MITKNDILRFIANFSKHPGALDMFQNGKCGWFAVILCHRFDKEETEVMYDPIANHFGVRIDNVVYDITGDVTNAYRWEEWDLYYKEDPVHGRRILRYCYYFDEQL
jgi:hypothetical protein